MQLDTVHAFVAVVQDNGFAAAGRRLKTPRSTLSRQIQRLEDELGVRLLERTTRRIRLTEAGEAYFHRCAHALDLIDAANRGARAEALQPKGTLKITAPFDIARDAVAGMLPEFRRRYPDVELDFEISQKPVDLLAEGIDLALRGGTRLPSSNLVAKKIGAHDFALFASPNYLAARGVPETPADLEHHDLIGFKTAAGALPWRLSGRGEIVELVPRAWLRSNELGLIQASILDGLGIGLLEPLLAAREVRSRRLQPVLPQYTMTGGALYALYPSSRRVAPKVRVFVAVLSEHLKRSGWAP